MFATSAAVTIAGLALLRVVILQLPVDFLSNERRFPEGWRSRHSIARLSRRLLKNLLGLTLLVAGLTMLFTPGPGLLAILLAVLFIELPGKHRLEVAILSRPAILRKINQWRCKSGRPSLRVPSPRDE